MTPLIISTVGTSLITNLFYKTNAAGNPVLLPEHRTTLNQHANTWEEHSSLESVFAIVDAYYADNPAAIANCAELATLMLYAQCMPLHVNARHLLLATQTQLGQYCAKKLQQFLISSHHEAEFRAVPFLHVGDPSHLNRGWLNLRDILNALHRIHGEVVYNVTGGYKLISSLVTTYATTHGSRVIYTFDNSEVLTVVDVNMRGTLPDIEMGVVFLQR